MATKVEMKRQDRVCLLIIDNGPERLIFQGLDSLQAILSIFVCKLFFKFFFKDCFECVEVYI